MSELSFSPQSVDDLDEIMEYIARDNPTAAERLIALLKEKCQRLSHMPRIGARCDHLAEGLRAFPVGRYIIYSAMSSIPLCHLLPTDGRRDSG